jgi:hypothetical protein
VGLFANLRRRRFQCRYRAAWALMLAQYTYFKLEPARKADVLALLDRHSAMAGAPRFGPVPRSSHPFWNAWLMVGMHSLYIEPALDGERWPLPENLRLGQRPLTNWGNFLPRPPKALQIANRLALDFRLLSQATQEARRDLIARGINLEVSAAHPSRMNLVQ